MSRQADQIEIRGHSQQKAESRRRDEERLACGEVSGNELRQANSFFGSLGISGFQLRAIGGRRLASGR